MTEDEVRTTAAERADEAAEFERYSAEQVDYVAEDVIVAVGHRELTSDGVLMIVEGSVAIFEAGDGPVADRMIVLAPATEARLVSKPKIGLGASFVLELGDTRYKVVPEAGYVGKTFVGPGAIKRGRASVAAFEAALEGARGS
jgi:hypothetical protein